MSSLHDFHRHQHRPHHQQHVAEQTKQRRAPHNCTQDEVQRYKAMRDMGFDFAVIAELEGKTEVEVMLAIAATRSPNPASGRCVVNTDTEGLALLLAKALPDEARGQTLMRVLHEHTVMERLLQR